ncbi:TPA: toll/interleukin-1 receptor domain-containing protein [Streptococcus pyogenes]|nr:toll/interleukin-1 receptor domain-containing protein [Streptococcus pyogenes]
MEKPIIFISHITEERDVAIELKKELSKYYRGMVTFFVSSDSVSIESGSDYYETIISNLKKCHFMITLCSPQSVKREWINFEAGFGVSRGIGVTPLLYKGLEFKDITSPIQRMQGYIMSDDSLNIIVKSIDEKFGFDNQYHDFNDFMTFVLEKATDTEVDAMKEFVKSVTRVIGEEKIKEISINQTDNGAPTQILITKTKYESLNEFVYSSVFKDDFEMDWRGGAVYPNGIEYTGIDITLSDRLNNYINDLYEL